MSQYFNSDNPACPCNPQRLYAECCKPFHQGNAAPTPELLMRSRYSAFAFLLADYLVKTWHSSSRPQQLILDKAPQWCSLSVKAAAMQGDNNGTVEFCAVYKSERGWGKLEERSHFVKENGQWYYRDGEAKDSLFKPGRNDVCPCGSGRKYKACCLK